MWSVIVSMTLVSASANLPVPQNHEVFLAARDYRLAVYEQCRHDRQRYEAFREAGDSLLANWVASREPTEHQGQVVAWFTESRQDLNTREATSLAALPDLPKRVVAETAQHTHSNAGSAGITVSGEVPPAAAQESPSELQIHLESPAPPAPVAAPAWEPSPASVASENPPAAVPVGPAPKDSVFSGLKRALWNTTLEASASRSR